MALRRPLHTRLLIVAVLGVFTAALSAAALYRAISASNTQRLERAREAVAEEIARLRTVGPEALAAPPTMVGLRGGLAREGGEILAGVPAEWRPALGDLLLRSPPGADGTLEMPLAAAHLVAMVGPAAGGRLAWAAIAVRPSPYLQSWRMLVVALAVLALLLVGNALYALVTVGRAARALQGALRALADDLSAPIPPVAVRELGDIADGVATLARHLAEARRIQERLGRDLARQERMAALGRVVAGVAHEVRNPLASIKLRLDLAMAEGDDGRSRLAPSTRQAIAHASSEITRLDRLVADLLIVSGRPLGPRLPVAVHDLARARAEALAPWAGLRHVAIHLDRVGGGDGTASADPDAIARALDNLLRNAVEASPDGGRVDLRVDAADEVLRIAVEDRGSGVPATRAPELFEPFFTTKAEGTGLGLAISRAIARAHGGDVVYVRDDGVTRFELVLPAALTPPPAANAGLPS
jgi:signal transduction histidine kinase